MGSCPALAYALPDTGRLLARWQALEEAQVSTTITLFGIALIAIALRDVFQELFRPSGGGVLSLCLMRRLARLRGERLPFFTRP